jgi:hypothetical protein
LESATYNCRPQNAMLGPAFKQSDLTPDLQERFSQLRRHFNAAVMVAG